MEWSTDPSGWADFLVRSPRGHYSQVPTFLRWYEEFGLRLEFGVQRDGGKIIGGTALVCFEKPFFRLLSCPMGPIVETGSERFLPGMLQALRQRADALKADGLLVRLPFAPHNSSPYLLNELPELEGFRQANREFPIVFAPGQLLLVEVPSGQDWRNELLSSFAGHAQRNIARAMKLGVEVLEATGEEAIRQGYSAIERNGRERGYRVRTWDTFGELLTNEIRSGHSMLLTAWHQGEVVGAHYLSLAGRRFSLILAGVDRRHPDLCAGYGLHWAAMEKAHALGFQHYDLTTQSVSGVMFAKQGFGPQRILLAPVWETVRSPLKWRLAMSFLPFLAKHRGALAGLYSRIKHA